MVPLGKVLFVVGIVFLIEAVSAETASRELLGKYYFGDGLGLNCYLELTKSGHFKYELVGCMGTYDQAEGSFMIDEKTLALTPNTPVASACGVDQKNFHVIRWDRLIYLVPESEMLQFCNNINMSPNQNALAHLMITSVSSDRSVAKIEIELAKIKKGDCFSSRSDFNCSR
jgi:hypothetical protein